MEWLALKTWLLETVQGVLLLGALGSVVGGIAVYLVKMCWVALADKRLLLIQRILFPIGIVIYRKERLVELMGPKTSDGKYVGYLIVESLFIVLEAIAFFSSFSFIVYVYLTYGLERPKILAFFNGCSIYFGYILFRDTVSVWSLISNDISDLAEKIHDESPKNIHEWRRFRLEQEAAKENAKRDAANQGA